MNAFVVVLVVIALKVRISWQTLLLLPGIIIVALNGAWMTILLGMVSARFRDVSPLVGGDAQLLSHPVLRNISLMMALVNFVGSTVYAQLVLFAKDRLLASDTQVGVLYSAGAAFHVWKALPFHNAIWHGFVVLAAGCHYAAIWQAVLLTSAGP